MGADQSGPRAIRGSSGGDSGVFGIQGSSVIQGSSEFRGLRVLTEVLLVRFGGPRVRERLMLGCRVGLGFRV